MALTDTQIRQARPKDADYWLTDGRGLRLCEPLFSHSETTMDTIQQQDEGTPNKPKSYGFWRTVIIVLCGHLGVRPSHKRKEDFERANGVYVFAVAVMYFVLVIAGLIVLVNYIAMR